MTQKNFQAEVTKNRFTNGLTFAKVDKNGEIKSIEHYDLRLKKVELNSVLRAVIKIKIAVNRVLNESKEDNRIKAVGAKVTCTRFNRMLQANYVMYVNNRGEILDKGLFTVEGNFNAATKITTKSQDKIDGLLANTAKKIVDKNGKIDFSNANLVAVIDEIVNGNIAIGEYKTKSLQALNKTINQISNEAKTAKNKKGTETNATKTENIEATKVA
jgi:hypothetical protein